MARMSPSLSLTGSLWWYKLFLAALQLAQTDGRASPRMTPLAYEPPFSLVLVSIR